MGEFLRDKANVAIVCILVFVVVAINVGEFDGAQAFNEVLGALTFDRYNVFFDSHIGWNTYILNHNGACEIGRNALCGRGGHLHRILCGTEQGADRHVGRG